MTNEVRLNHLQCNIDCKYCYQETVRNAGNVKNEYDFESVKNTLENTREHFTLSGGEPLMTDKNKLEEILRWGDENFGKTGLQTNGVLIDDDHLEMFRKYNVNVGISVDGPEELNDPRWSKNLERTRENTKTTMENLEKLLNDPEISTGIIITLHKANIGTDDRLEKLKEFIRWLEKNGKTQGYLHFLVTPFSDSAIDDCSVPPDQYKEAFLELAQFNETHPELNWKPFEDIEKMLRDQHHNTLCTWNNCDPFTTSALAAIHFDGSVNRCARLYTSGFPWEKANEPYYGRYLSLYQTPQEMGGCKGCRFFLFCGGSCPSRSLNRDWRNKPYDCSLLKELFKFYEQKIESEGKTPQSKRDDLDEILNKVVNYWENGKHVPLRWFMDPDRNPDEHPGIDVELLQTPGKVDDEHNFSNRVPDRSERLTEKDIRTGNWSPGSNHSDNHIHTDGSQAHIDSDS